MSLRPLLKWTGSKRVLGERVRRAFDSPTVRYMEPFMGGLSVYIQRLLVGDLKPSHEVVLADLSAPLVSFYQGLRSQPQDVLREMNRLDWNAGWRSSYEDLRREMNESLPSQSVAIVPSARWTAVFLWVNRACFNGLARYNQQGLFNTPAGSYETLSRPFDNDVLAFYEAIRWVRILHSDFTKVLELAGEGWQVYEDPPYHDAFDAYTGKTWTYDDQVRLAMDSARARSRGAHIVASNADHPEVRALWQAVGFEVRGVQVQHTVGAAASSRGKKAEVLLVGKPDRAPIG